MKKFGILALVLVFTMMLSVVSFAAEPAFKVVERDDAAYDPDVTKVTPGSGNIVVSTDATEGAYYGVLLVNGVLPTVDDAGNNNILYINQETAGNSGTVSFDVLPIMPADNLEAPLTLYISSNASGENLIIVPVAYGAETETPVVPEVSIADINNDGEVLANDAMEVINFVNWEASLLDAMDWDTQALPVADINGDGDILANDAMEIVNYVNWEPSLLDTIIQ